MGSAPFVVLALSGCAYHATGLVSPSGPGVALHETDGQVWPLVVSGDASWLSALDGHVTEIWGRRAAHRLVVTQFRIHDGLHGLPTWAGLLEAPGLQLGLRDHDTGDWIVVHPDADEILRPYVGQPVLIEGYEDLDGRIRVLYWRPLAPGPTPGG